MDRGAGGYFASLKYNEWFIVLFYEVGVFLNSDVHFPYCSILTLCLLNEQSI